MERDIECRRSPASGPKGWFLRLKEMDGESELSKVQLISSKRSGYRVLFIHDLDLSIICRQGGIFEGSEKALGQISGPSVSGGNAA